MFVDFSYGRLPSAIAMGCFISRDLRGPARPATRNPGQAGRRVWAGVAIDGALARVMSDLAYPLLPFDQR